MATFTKFNCFTTDILIKKHNLSSDTIKVLLTNAAPSAADTVVDTTTGTCTVKSTSNAAEIAAQNGYAKGGFAVTIVSVSDAGSGVATVVGTDTANNPSGGTFGPFQWAVMYNDTAGTTSTRPVIGFWNRGSAITPDSANGDTFTLNFTDASNIVLTIT
jgi:hypothetical protein